MATPNPSARRKVWKPKSKTGCLTCRIRRVKCGEEKPECLRCTRTGRKCDGYNHEKMRKSEDVENSGRSVRNSPASASTSPQPLRSEWNDPEETAMHFFQTKTIPEISGYFETTFWSSLVKETSQYDPAVRHAAIALGSLHEAFKSGDIRAPSVHNPNSKKQFALQQKIKAIRHLNDHISAAGGNQSPEVILIACLLLICLEIMQGNYQAAFTHLESGLKIMSDWLPRDGQPARMGGPMSQTNRKVIEEDLVPIFARLDVQASTFLTSRSDHYDLLSRHGQTNSQNLQYGAPPPVPDSFWSLHEARKSLDQQAQWMVFYGKAMADRRYSPSNNIGGLESWDGLLQILVDGQRESAFRLQCWSNAFHAFLQENDNGRGLQGKEFCGATTLNLNYFTSRLLLDTATLGDELGFDRFRAEFEIITSLAENIMRSLPPVPDPDMRNAPNFQLDTAIIPSLYFVVCKCRDPSIRRRAIALLSASPRQEGVWESRYIASIGQWIMKKEEEGLGGLMTAHEIPESSRVAIIEKTVMAGKKCLLKYHHGVRSTPGGTLKIEEHTISW